LLSLAFHRSKSRAAWRRRSPLPIRIQVKFARISGLDWLWLKLRSGEIANLIAIRDKISGILGAYCDTR
jgi:hypothetical protein